MIKQKTKFAENVILLKSQKKYNDQNNSVSLVSIFAAFTTKNMRK